LARFAQEVLGPGARWRDGVAEADGNVYDLAELARLYRARHAGDVLEARASYTPDTDFPDKSFYGNPSPAYPFAAHVAEVAIDPVPAAVANAIAHALGVRGKALPLTGEVLWRALRDGERAHLRVRERDRQEGEAASGADENRSAADAE
jgi:CO/xanthine dehydrogenase Mo-binding subunit